MEYTQRQELLYKEGVRLLKEHGKASCVLFQRKLAIGYGAAREIVDRMLEEGIATSGKDYTIILNKEGEKKMRNTTFYGMEAKDFLEKVIERENRFKNTDYSALSFEEKCEYALWYINEGKLFNQALADDKLADIKNLVLKRAIDRDPAGLYYLAKFWTLFGITLEARLEYLKRSSDMGYMPATVLYLCMCTDAEKRYQIARELVNKISSIEPISLRCTAIRGVYTALGKVEGKDKYPHYHDLTHDLYVELAKEGDMSAFTWLESIATRKVKKAKTDEERLDAEAECAFFETVQYMVDDYYYNQGVLEYEKHLGFMLLSGVGCEVDIERGIKLVLSDMRRTIQSFDKDMAIKVIRFVNGHAEERLWGSKLINAIFDGNDKAIEDIVADIIALDNAVEIFNRASSLLYSAKH